MKFLGPLATALTLATAPLAAQGLFSPAILVDDSVITGYELQQRELMLEVFRTPGNLQALAREQLIEDRLKQAEIDRAGLRLSDDGLQQAMSDFAGRANLDLEGFLNVLSQNGVSEETFRDFVSNGVAWRDYIRSRFAGQAEISEAEIDQAIGARSGSGTAIEVLLNEIIIAAPPPRAAQALATAQRISELTSISAFQAEARRVSALPSRTRGGRLDWLPISNYPRAIQTLLLDLSPGEVTVPLPITNGVALFQLRDVREVPQERAAPAAIEYAAYYISGGLAATDTARAIDARVDTCDDLYGVAQGQPEEVLERDSLPPDDIPEDIALELAKLDPGEASYTVTRAEGETLVFLMLCGRTPELDVEEDREAIRNQLRSRRLAGFADALLADLRAQATIREP